MNMSIALRQRVNAIGGNNTSSLLPQTHHDNERTKRRRRKPAKKRHRMRIALIICPVIFLSLGVYYTIEWNDTNDKSDGKSESLNSPTIRTPPQLSSSKHTFATPNLTPGQVSPLHWSNDNTLVQKYGARIGLPPQLIPTLTSYAQDMGLLDIMKNMLYDNPLQPGDDARWFTFQSPYQTTGNGPMRNFTWNVERPDKHWKSDMHWFNTADELAHEDSLRALAKGGFDQVLEGIGTMYGLDTLHVDSVGFVAVTNCERGYIHHDWDDVDGRAFNFLVGIHSPLDAGAELYIENDEERRGEVKYGSNAGILVGDGTRHGTKECDHRSQREVRITCSIYLADVTEDNLSILAGDTTSIFPPTGRVSADWMWRQRGRHWDKNGGRSLMEDVGRTSFSVEDDSDDCSRYQCLAVEVDVGGYRNDCMKTCEVFMDDNDYQPGERRHKVLGY